MERRTRTNTQPTTCENMLKSRDDRTVHDIHAYKIFESKKYIYATFDLFVHTSSTDENSGFYVCIAGAYYSKEKQTWYTPDLKKRDGDKYAYSAWYSDSDLFKIMFPELPVKSK